MKKMSMLLIAGCLLAGCISIQHEIGKPIDQSAAAQIFEGKTTESQVIALMGEPQSVREIPGGSKMFMYMHYQTGVIAAPNLARTSGDSSSRSLVITFKDGVVTSKSASATNMPSKMSVTKTLTPPN